MAPPKRVPKQVPKWVWLHLHPGISRDLGLGNERGAKLKLKEQVKLHSKPWLCVRATKEGSGVNWGGRKGTGERG